MTRTAGLRGLTFGDPLPLTSWRSRAAALPAIPSHRHRAESVTDWQMLGNDVWGNCVPVGAAHAIRALNAELGSSVIVPWTEAETVATYEQVTGATLPPGPGCVETDFLRTWHQSGLNGHRLDSFAPLAVASDEQELCSSIFYLGVAFLGWGLPSYAEQQFQTDALWDVMPGYFPPQDGHCTIAVGYDAAGLDLVGWGERYRCTWAFARKYLQQSYALVMPEAVSTGYGPGELPLAEMRAECAAL